MRKITSPIILFIFLTGINLSVFAQDANWPFYKDSPKKNATIPSFIEMAKPTTTPTTTITIDATNNVAKVSKYIYGTNANQYTGSYNNEPLLIDYIKKLSPNIIRYPGGLHSEGYFWNVKYDWNLISPAHPNGWFVNLPTDLPDKVWTDAGIFNSASWTPGGGYWTFGLDDYYKFLVLSGTEGLITVNYNYARYGTGPTPVQTAAHLAADWVRYDKGRTKYWEVGNESCAYWSAGYKIDKTLNKDNQPEIITTELYGQHFKIFADSMHKAATEIGSTIYIGAQWEGDFFKSAGNTADWYITHSYFTPYNENSTVATILNSPSTELGSLMTALSAARLKYTADAKPIGMTEYNIFASGSKQPSSYINGMQEVLAICEMIKNKYGMANRWDIANSWSNGDDLGMFARAGEVSGEPTWNPRPSFFYLYYLQKYFGDQMVSAVSDNSNVISYASKFTSGQSGIVVVNKGTTAQVVKINIQNFSLGDRYYVYSLTGGTDNGEFSLKVSVNDTPPDNAIGGPINTLENIKAQSALIGNGIMVNAPARSVQYVLVDNHPVSLNPLESSTVTLFPNPTHHLFYINLRYPGFTKMDILGLNGKIVYTKNIGKSETSLRINVNLPTGLYIVKLYNTKEILLKKLIIN